MWEGDDSTLLVDVILIVAVPLFGLIADTWRSNTDNFGRDYIASCLCDRNPNDHSRTQIQQVMFLHMTLLVRGLITSHGTR